MESPFESKLIDQLQRLFEGLAVGPTGSISSGNRCGQCRVCCTADGLSQQNVTELELALLTRFHGEHKAQNFARYARRQRTEEGHYLHEVCPNLGPDGCEVYAVRPFSCRVFGSYRVDSTRLPEVCVYAGLDQEFPAARYYATVPGAATLRQLSRDYQLRKPSDPASTAAGAASGVGAVGLNGDDPWDRALELVVQGQAVSANLELPALSEAEPVFASYVRALVAGELNEHEKAAAAYSLVLDHFPQRADLRTFCGFHLFQLGRYTQAESQWIKSLQADPGNSLTYSFLGYLYSHHKQWQMAADFFGAAAELDPAQPVHRQRRDEALAQVAGGE